MSKSHTPLWSFVLLEGKQRINMGVFDMCPPKLKTMKGNKNGRKRSENDENEAISNKIATYRARLTADRRFRPTIGGRFQDFCNLVSWIQELKTYFQDFDIQLGDLKDELGRRSGFNCGFDYSQGCLELKKEEQSRETNWGLIWAID
ncbi:hypothetical protein M9H77_06925 [Catharanthus roseus]|uniref:Uncharacterized protein n=1 Tax=Catharanthus roseus TaxID=4058 RepID=A0ACC0BTL6_CATRO|nr:hypothetical protein M9H77_06925 [Catharanthus roseus]